MLSCANTFGMFFLRAACSATKFTPNDQEAMFANRVTRKMMQMSMKMGDASPTMVITA